MEAQQQGAARAHRHLSVLAIEEVGVNRLLRRRCLLSLAPCPSHTVVLSDGALVSLFWVQMSSFKFPSRTCLARCFRSSCSHIAMAVCCSLTTAIRATPM